MTHPEMFDDVHEFHTKFGHPTPPAPTMEGVRIDLRKKLTQEECVDELHKALDEGDLPGIADAVCDGIYVLLGTAIECGIDIRPVWDEVQRANMAKTGGATRSDGKTLKPEGWTPPQIERVLQEQGLR